MAKTEKMKSLATEIIGKIRAFLMDNIELKSLFSGETSQKEMDEEVRQMIVKQRGTILSLLANALSLKTYALRMTISRRKRMERKLSFQRYSAVIALLILKQPS